MVLKPGRVVLILLILLLCAGFLYFYHHRDLNAEDILQKALQQEKKITSYHLVLELESNRKGEVREHFVQVWYRSPHFFRVEFFSCYPEKGAQPNQVIVSDGNKICLFSPEMGDYFALNPSFERIAPTPFLLNTFYSGLAKSQESEFLGIEKKEKNVYYLLRIVPPVPQKDRAYEEIWLERRTLLPVQILTYDEQEQVQQRVLFHKTVLNTVISEELFKIDEKGGAASQ